MTILTPDADRPDVDPGAMATRTGASDAGPVTGPIPAVDLVDGHLHVSIRRQVTLVQLDGGLDRRLADLLVPAIEAAIVDAEAVVLDLDQVTLLDREALQRLCETLRDRAACLVASRLSGRLVLERWEVPDRFAVFTSIADALQAREFVESGYGTGWRTSSA